MNIVEIRFPRFSSVFVAGPIEHERKERIWKVLRTMSNDEYAGYSPLEKEKYDKVMRLLAGYTRTPVSVLAWYD